MSDINDDIQNTGDQLRDLIETSLIITDPPATGWRPDDKDLC